MMARTTREQMVTYVSPPLYQEFVGVVEAGKAKGMRVSLSSLCEEAMAVGLDYVKGRYLGESKPIRKARRRFASV